MVQCTLAVCTKIFKNFGDFTEQIVNTKQIHAQALKLEDNITNRTSHGFPQLPHTLLGRPDYTPVTKEEQTAIYKAMGGELGTRAGTSLSTFTVWLLTLLKGITGTNVQMAMFIQLENVEGQCNKVPVLNVELPLVVEITRSLVEIQSLLHLKKVLVVNDTKETING